MSDREDVEHLAVYRHTNGMWHWFFLADQFIEQEHEGLFAYMVGDSRPTRVPEGFRYAEHLNAAAYFSNDEQMRELLESISQQLPKP